MAPLVTPCHLPPPLLTPASAHPCSSSVADDLGLEICVDEVDESEDENNEVFVEVDDNSDTD